MGHLAGSSALVVTALVLLAGPGVTQELPPAEPPPPQDAPTAPEAGAAGTGTAPPGMPWQRSLDDALALSRSSGKPLLLCVNMDGELASDRLARGRYRDASFIALASGFVPLIVSPDEHTSRDHDDRGRRLVDPRFGRVVDGEHIALEPVLYERYFGGTRVAPRHVGVAPDGEILFDLYLLDDLGRIDEALARHGRFDVKLTDPAGLDQAGLLSSHDAAARERLEAHFLASDDATRGRLITAALDPASSVHHPELLRLALRDPSAEVSGAAVSALIAAPDRLPLELATEVLRVAQEQSVPTGPLADGLLVRSTSLPDEAEAGRALRLARLFAAVGTPSSLIDAELWQLALVGRPPAEPIPETLDFHELYAAVGRIEERLDALPATARDERVVLLAALARASLRAAESQLWSSSPDTGYLLADAQTAAQDATAADPDDAFSWATLARASYLVGEGPLAVQAAERALPGLLGAAATPLAAQVIEALANGRANALRAALDAGDEWPVHWLADLLAAYDVLAVHPHGSVDRLAAALDVLAALELHGAHGRLARVAVERHPEAPRLHDHYRWHVQRDRGAAALPAAYEGFEVGDDVLPTWLWFDGFAQLIAADHQREAGAGAQALAAYEQSIERFERSLELEPAFGNVRDFVGLARAGMAGVHLDAGDLRAAAATLQAAARSSAVSFRMPDSMGNTPADLIRRLGRALRRAGLDELEAQVAATLRERGVEVRRR